MNLFDKPRSDWSDDELRAGLGVLASARDVAAARGEVATAELLNTMACLLADERDSRRRLARDVDEAMNPVQVVGPVVFGPDDDEDDAVD